MATASIITFIVFLIVAAIMIGIGISQLRNSSPVAFYSGEKPPKAEELTDVHAWNKKHGMMWIIYGITIISSYFAGYIIGDSILCIFPFCGGLIVPVIIMIWYHNKLIKMYKR